MWLPRVWMEVRCWSRVLGATFGTGARLANVRLASRDIDTSMMGESGGRSLTTGSIVDDGS